MLSNASGAYNGTIVLSWRIRHAPNGTPPHDVVRIPFKIGVFDQFLTCCLPRVVRSRLNRPRPTSIRDAAAWREQSCPGPSRRLLVRP